MAKKTNGSTLEKIAKEVANHTKLLKNIAMKSDLVNFATKDDLKNFATKTELNEFKNETLVRLDKIIATQEKHEQERIFAFEQSRRPEEQIDKNTKDIKHIKEVIHIN